MAEPQERIRSSKGGAHIKLRRDIDPSSITRAELETKTLKKKGDWDVSDIVEYGTAFFNKQSKVADLPKPSDPDNPGFFATKVYREALRRAKKWLKDNPDHKHDKDRDKRKKVKVPRAAGIKIAKSMGGTFEVTPEEMVVIREREYERERAREREREHEHIYLQRGTGMRLDEAVAYAIARAQASENDPAAEADEYYRREEFLFRNLVTYMLNILISKENKGRGLDLARLRGDLLSYADLLDFVASQGADESSVRQVEELYERLSEYRNYLWEGKEEVTKAKEPVTGVKGYDQAGYGRFTPFVERAGNYDPGEAFASSDPYDDDLA